MHTLSLDQQVVFLQHMRNLTILLLTHWQTSFVFCLQLGQTSQQFCPTMDRIRTNFIPIIILLFGVVITRTYYAADAREKVVFQFPEYDYKETSKNVSKKKSGVSLIDFSRIFLK